MAYVTICNAMQQQIVMRGATSVYRFMAYDTKSYTRAIAEIESVQKLQHRNHATTAKGIHAFTFHDS